MLIELSDGTLVEVSDDNPSIVELDDGVFVEIDAEDDEEDSCLVDPANN